MADGSRSRSSPTTAGGTSARAWRPCWGRRAYRTWWWWTTPPPTARGRCWRGFGAASGRSATPATWASRRRRTRPSRPRPGDWVLALNPDVLLRPGFVRLLVEAGAIDDGVGTVCGRLLSIGADFKPPPEPRIDSTGIYFTPVDAALRPRLARARRRPLPPHGVRLRRQRRGGALPPRDDRGYLRRKASSSTPISSPTARTPTWPGARNCWAGAASTRPAAVAYHVRTVVPAEPPQRARRHQHALGEEPLPDADQECDAGASGGASGCP